MGTVYLLTFPNGKLYVGVTFKKTAARRLYDHTIKANNGSQAAVHNAMRKHGCPELSVLEDCDDEHLLKMLEVVWIEELQTKAPNGYNLTDGGEGTVGLNFSPQHRSRIGDSKRGKPIPEEVRKKMSSALKGRIFRPETIAAMSAARQAWWERKRAQ